MANGIALINLETGAAWVFQFFPPSIGLDDRANWESQDVTRGTKPLLYANREPQRITIDDVLLDASETGESLTKEIKELRDLMNETDKGAPPALRLICGDWQQVVVMEGLQTRQELFSREGVPLRVRLSMTFLERRQSERATLKVIEPDGEFNSVGNF